MLIYSATPKKQEPKDGDRWQEFKFAWCPTVMDDSSLIWLETYTIKKEAAINDAGFLQIDIIARVRIEWDS